MGKELLKELIDKGVITLDDIVKYIKSEDLELTTIRLLEPNDKDFNQIYDIFECQNYEPY